MAFQLRLRHPPSLVTPVSPSPADCKLISCKGITNYTGEDHGGELSAIWPAIGEQLEKQGIGLDALCEDVECGTGVKVVCVGARLGDSLEAMGETARDQVVMVGLTRRRSRRWMRG
jgi:hypothetical protein